MAKSIKKEENKSVNNVLSIMAFIIVVIAVVSLATTFIKISQLNNELSGYATLTINISVNTSLSHVSDRDLINWGAGQIGNGSNNATLMTSRNESNMSDSSWDNSTVTGFILRNDGNTNISLNFTFQHNATELFGPLSFSGRSYKINVSNKEAGSCDGLGVEMDAWLEVNQTVNEGVGWMICKKMSSLEGNNEIWVDAMLIVPYDTNNTNFDLQTQITTTASAAL